MIADWTVDAGLESPRITVPWAGWVDLRAGTAAMEAPMRSLAEVQACPELAALLVAANTATMMTAKVDVFPVSAEEADPEMLDALQETDGSNDCLEQACVGFGSYLDVVLVPDLIPALPLSEAFPYFERIARSAVRIVRTVEHRLGCAEIVIRPAQLYDRDTFGWTLYATGFGTDETAARDTWAPVAASLVVALEQAIAEATETVESRASSSIG